MTRTFRPRLDILPAAQKRLWTELADLPANFTLYGGTAIAVRLGHRESIDFDFFTSQDIDPRTLLSDLPLLSGAEVLDIQPNTLTVGLDRDGPVKVSFFGVPKLGRVKPVLRAEDIGLAVADLLDLGGTKVSVVQVRAEIKDYMDIDALISSGLGLPDMLAAGSSLYGQSFTPLSALKALAYFEDDSLKALPAAVKDRLRRAVRAVDLDRLPVIPRLPDEETSS